MAEDNGIRIDAYLRDRGRVPPGKAARIAVEILARIAERLAAGDVRGATGILPGRILISPDGRVGLLDPPDSSPAASSAPAYASPEEIRGQAPDGRSAVYSFGCAFFEILTGRPPFTADSAEALRQAHLTTPAPDAASIQAGIPQALAQTVSRLLEKDPANRPADPAEASRMLREALLGRAPAPLPEPAPEPAQGRGAEEMELVQIDAPASRAPAPPTPFPEASPALLSPEALDIVLEDPIEEEDIPEILPAGEMPQAREEAPIARPPSSGGKPVRPGAAVRRITPLPRGKVPGPAGSGPRPGRPAPAAAKSGGPVRRRLGAPPPTPAPILSNGDPVPKKPWLFTWCGLAGGILLSIIVYAMNSSGHPAAKDDSAKKEKDLLETRLKDVKTGYENEDRMAESAFDGLNSRISDQERIDAMVPLIARYAHTTVVKKKAELVADLRVRIQETEKNKEEEAKAKKEAPAATPEEGTDASADGAQAEPAPTEIPDPAPAGDPPASSGKAKAGGKTTDGDPKKEGSEDDVGGAPGGDDGKGEL